MLRITVPLALTITATLAFFFSKQTSTDVAVTNKGKEEMSIIDIARQKKEEKIEHILTCNTNTSNSMKINELTKQEIKEVKEIKEIKPNFRFPAWEQIEEADIQHLFQLARKKIPDFPPPPNNKVIIQLAQETKGGRESKGEACCRTTMEQLFPGGQWRKARPSWCKNPETGRNLELDVFSEELGIAVEYNGQQHYVNDNFFHQAGGDYNKQKKRDEMKVEMCDRQGVYLLIVPYWIPNDQIPKYIYCQMLQDALK